MKKRIIVCATLFTSGIALVAQKLWEKKKLDTQRKEQLCVLEAQPPQDALVGDSEAVGESVATLPEKEVCYNHLLLDNDHVTIKLIQVTTVADTDSEEHPLLYKLLLKIRNFTEDIAWQLKVERLLIAGQLIETKNRELNDDVLVGGDNLVELFIQADFGDHLPNIADGFDLTISLNNAFETDDVITVNYDISLDKL